MNVSTLFIIIGLSQGAQHADIDLQKSKEVTFAKVTMKQAVGDLAGPSWFVFDAGKRIRIPARREAEKFVADYKGLHYTVQAHSYREATDIVATLSNPSKETLYLPRCGLLSGIDTNMEKYPDWNDTLFPTLLRCEKTHFWGYLMTPHGRIVTIASPDPVPSYSLDYNDGGHRIRTFSLDLINRGHLPVRNPTSPQTIAPAGSISWHFTLREAPNLASVKLIAAALAKAPMLDASDYTLEPGKPTHLTVLCPTGKPELTATGPNQHIRRLLLKEDNPSHWSCSFTPDLEPGITTLTATCRQKITEAKITVRKPWGWYLDHARSACMTYRQKASSHIESVYGFFPAFQARQLEPKSAVDKIVEDDFWRVFNLGYKGANLTPQSYPNRIQNSAGYAEMLASLFKCNHDLATLQKASKLADFVISKQHPDGGYYSYNTLYTSVIYVGKSVMAVGLTEQDFARTQPLNSEWYSISRRHLDSAFRAMDDLAKRLDNIDTEGEATYEDGMISCSATQLGMAALITQDPARRLRYRSAAEHFLNGHRCLEQLIIPDSRMNGGTLRFWESQYDVMVTPNMMCSPHGWSAWRIYAEMYRYFATGDVESLRRSMNALGSCAQLMSPDGKLRWAFVPDPYIEASVFVPDPAKPGWGKQVRRTIGEQYIDMVSDWWQAPLDRIIGGYVDMDSNNPGPACDSDVNEIFKCIGELAVTQGYVAEVSPGIFEGWNCRVVRNKSGLIVIPNEKLIHQIHVNAKRAVKVTVQFAKGKVSNMGSGMKWIVEPGSQNNWLANNSSR